MATESDLQASRQSGPANDLVEVGLSTRSVLGVRRDAPSKGNSWIAPVSRLILPLALLLVWQVVTANGLVDRRILTPPGKVLSSLYDLADSGELWTALQYSLARAGVGYLLAAAIGVLLGIGAGLWLLLDRAYDTLVQLLRTVPFLALLPLFVAWFGFGELPKILIITTAAIFPIYLAVYTAIRSVDSKQLEAATVYEASNLSTIFGIIIPQSIPGIFSGLRYGLGISLVALVASEQINAQEGIGYIAMSPRAAMRPDIVLVIVLVYAVLGLACDTLLRLIERLITPWVRP